MTRQLAKFLLALLAGMSACSEIALVPCGNSTAGSCYAVGDYEPEGIVGSGSSLSYVLNVSSSSDLQNGAFVISSVNMTTGSLRITVRVIYRDRKNAFWDQEDEDITCHNKECFHRDALDICTDGSYLVDAVLVEITNICDQPINFTLQFSASNDVQVCNDDGTDRLVMMVAVFGCIFMLFCPVICAKYYQEYRKRLLLKNLSERAAEIEIYPAGVQSPSKKTNNRNNSSVDFLSYPTYMAYLQRHEVQQSSSPATPCNIESLI
eukprot:TRINITY_DN2829_c0_g1_i1.p1 TRINITY_DN2829_c0_g1~~TRINITY_DN2829_c0_g1_i1.p1  ORF type:complete len:264 (+),score=23.59 TRINITY_DN2829_c0_g1_i1:170-961(+)